MQVHLYRNPQFHIRLPVCHFLVKVSLKEVHLHLPPKRKWPDYHMNCPIPHFDLNPDLTSLNP